MFHISMLHFLPLPLILFASFLKFSSARLSCSLDLWSSFLLQGAERERERRGRRRENGRRGEEGREGEGRGEERRGEKGREGRRGEEGRGKGEERREGREREEMR